MDIEVDESAEEDEVPVGKELYGMNIVFAGTKKDLGKTRDVSERDFRSWF